MTRVLIIDDSPTETHQLRELLNKHAFEVISADSAEIGISMVREHLPDLILMDVVMPGMNGFQATRQLTRDPQTAAIPIIILTTKNQDADKVWGSRQGARAYLTKPVTESLLLDTIQQVLAQAGG